jgi:hypothetical protein
MLFFPANFDGIVFCQFLPETDKKYKTNPVYPVNPVQKYF